MATITTGIQLADNFSAPLMHIISSVNMAISSIYDMDQAMNAGVNTASLEAARNEIAQATVAAEEFNQTMQQASSPINDLIKIFLGHLLIWIWHLIRPLSVVLLILSDMERLCTDHQRYNSVPH